MDAIDAIDAILTTRAMRRYTDEPVTDAEIEQCLAAAQQAPSGGNLQPWQFLVVTEAEPKAAVGEIYRRCYHRYEAALLASQPAFPTDEAKAAWERTLDASRYLADHLGQAPALVLVLQPKMDLTLHDADGPLDIGTPAASVYPAVQNLMVAARSLGIGSALTTVYRIEQQAVREVLGVPERLEIVALVPLGRPRGSFGVAPRRPVAQVTSWNVYGNRRTS